MKDRLSQTKRIIDLFLICSLLGLIFTIAYWIRVPEGVDHSVMDAEFEFSDFFLHVWYARLGPDVYYESYHACFPPLAYCFYLFIWMINRLRTPVSDWDELRFANQFPLIVTMYTVLLCVGIVLCVRAYLSAEPEWKKNLACVLIILSYPLMGSSLQRGNSVALVALMLAVSYAWRDAEEAWKREAALLLIAVSAGFKVYPAFFGILYLYEKRWKEAVRLVIYGVILFFAPFVFFGGFAGMRAFFMLLLARGEEYITVWYSVRGVVCRFLPSTVPRETAILTGRICENAFLLLCIWAGYKAGKTWRRLFFVCLVLTVYVPVNQIYSLVYMLPACLAFLKEEGAGLLRPERVEKNTWGGVNHIVTILTAIAFGIIFSMPSWQNYLFRGPDGMVVCHVVLYFMGAIHIVERFMTNTGGLGGKIPCPRGDDVARPEPDLVEDARDIEADDTEPQQRDRTDDELQ